MLLWSTYALRGGHDASGEGVLSFDFDLATGKDFRRFDIPTAGFVSSRLRTGDPVGAEVCGSY